MKDSTTLSTRALNRAFLARQLLLARERLPVARAIERLAGLQAQQPRPPFIGLWTRLAGFQRESLLALLQQRRVVRATMMRATIHLVTAKDYLAFRTAIQPALTAAMKSALGSRAPQMQEDMVVAAAERCFKQRPQTFAELRAALANEFPNLDERAMGYLARTRLPLVMTPDGADYGFSDSIFAAAEWWLGRGVDSKDRVEDLVLRYLAAFGPASARDAQTWSGLPNLQPVFERLRSKLEVFRDDHQRELFDLPGAPRPDAGTPVPVRFIPGFDNLILSHVDRTRIIADEYRPRVSLKNLQILPTFLVDGFVAGTWDVTRKGSTATLTISPFKPLSRAIKNDLTAEAENLVRFVGHQAAKHEVVFQGD